MKLLKGYYNFGHECEGCETLFELNVRIFDDIPGMDPDPIDVKCPFCNYINQVGLIPIEDKANITLNDFLANPLVLKTYQMKVIIHDGKETLEEFPHEETGYICCGTKKEVHIYAKRNPKESKKSDKIEVIRQGIQTIRDIMAETGFIDPEIEETLSTIDSLLTDLEVNEIEEKILDIFDKETTERKERIKQLEKFERAEKFKKSITYMKRSIILLRDMRMRVKEEFCRSSPGVDRGSEVSSKINGGK